MSASYKRTSLSLQHVKSRTTISMSGLHPLLDLHLSPIEPVVFWRSSGGFHLEAGFPLRCFQRLSLPHMATQRCSWRNNWHTSGASIPVLSY